MATLLLPSACRSCISASATKITVFQTRPFYSPFLSPPSWLARSVFTAPSGSTSDDVGFKPQGFLSLWPNYRSRIVHSQTRRLLWIMLQREWDEALERELTDAKVFLRPHIVDQVIGCIPSPRLALQFFIWAGEQIGYPPLTSKATCDIAQWYASKTQLFPFLKILRGLQNPHFGLSPSRANVLLQGYGWACMLDRAFTVMMRSHGFSNDVLVKCFLHTIMKQCRYDMVYNVYVEVTKFGTRLDLCYNELVQGMAFAGGQNCHEADILFQKMSESGHIPNEETCNALIISLSQAGKHERADALLKDMIKGKRKLASTAVVAVIESLCHAKEVQKALRIISEMKQRGVVLNSKVYRSLLETLGGQGGPLK